MTRRAPSVAILAVVLVGTAIAGCGKSTPPQESALPYVNVWSADPGIDLFSRGAELIRAAHESAWLVDIAGLDRAYDGYREALVDIRNESKMEYFFTQTEKGTRGTRWMEDTKGENHYERITSYTADDKTVVATVCRYVIPVEGVPADSVRQDIFKDNMSVVDIRLENAVNQPGEAGIADRDPGTQNPDARRPPRWNIFGTWKITRISRNLDFDPENCASWFQQQLPDLRRVPESKLLKVPDSFRIPPRPLAIQYPEWIGPST